MLKTLTYAAVALAVIAGAAPAMAQSFQPFAVQAASPTEASDLTGGRWMLLQGYGKDGEVNYTWYYVKHPDLSRYHGS